MKGVLTKIPPLHAPLIPPAGAIPAGLTPRGHQLFRLDRPRSKSVPLTDEKGEQVWRRHMTTGEPMYKLRKSRLYVEHLLFFLESQGNGNVVMTPYIPPSAQELAKAERDRKIAEMKDWLPGALVDAGTTPEQLLALMEQGSKAPAAPDAGPEAPSATSEEPEAPKEYPIDHNGGWWTLSNGEKFRGKKDEAVMAEELVKEARAAAGETPGY